MKRFGMNMHIYAHFRELAWVVGIWYCDVYVTEKWLINGFSLQFGTSLPKEVLSNPLL